MAIEKDVATEIASELASLQAEQGPGEELESEEAAPEADSVEGDPEADEESEEIEETEDEADESLEDEPADTGDASVDEIRDLIDSGDLKAAAEKLGLDPSIFKLNNRQFKASRTAVKEAKAAQKAAEERAATAALAQKQAEELNTAAEETYGPVVAGRFFYKGDPAKGVAPDPLKARAALELLFDDKYENIVANLAQAAKGLSPEQLQIYQLRKELADKEAAKTKEAETKTATEQTATEISAIAAKLKGTQLEDLADEAAKEIHAIVAASYNKALKKHTKTVKEAYKEVKAAYAAKAAKLAKLGGKPPAKPAKAPERKQLDRKIAPRVPAKKLTEDQEFAAELALAKKETQAALRREQRRAK